MPAESCAFCHLPVRWWQRGNGYRRRRKAQLRVPPLFRVHPWPAAMHERCGRRSLSWL